MALRPTTRYYDFGLKVKDFKQKLRVLEHILEEDS